MSADNRPVLLRIKGRLYAKVVVASDDLLDPEFAMAKAREFLDHPGPVFENFGQATEYLGLEMQAIERQGSEVEYPQILYVEVDPEKSQVRELKLGAL